MVDVQKAAGDSADYLKAISLSLSYFLSPRGRKSAGDYPYLCVFCYCFSSTRASGARWTSSCGSPPWAREERACPSSPGADFGAAESPVDSCVVDGEPTHQLLLSVSMSSPLTHFSTVD